MKKGFELFESISVFLYLEDIGHYPLMFYLKCLSDEDEIQDLMKREIDVREWFIYCESENAAKFN